MSCSKGKFNHTIHFLVFSIVCFVHFYIQRHEREIPLPRSFKQIRPRAEELCTPEDLKAGELVMVNYNMEDHKQRGLWSVNNLPFICTFK